MACVRSTSEIIRLLRELRERAGVSQYALARALGLKSHSDIARRERGRTPWTYDEVYRASKFLGVSNLAEGAAGTLEPKDPGIKVLAELLGRMEEAERREVIEIAAKFLEPRITAPKDHAQLRLLRLIVGTKRRKGRRA